MKHLPAGKMRPLTLILLAVAVLTACNQRTGHSTREAAADSRYLLVARGHVDIEGGLLKLRFPINGRITEVLAHPGDRVRPGQALARLDDRQATTEVAIAAAQLEQAQGQLGILKIKIGAAQRRAAALKEAARSGVGDAQSADAAAETSALLSAQSVTARSAIEIARLKLQQARLRLAQHTITAPVAAEVIDVFAQPGMSVSPSVSDNVFTLLPEVPLLVRADVGEHFINRLQPGMKAEIVYDNDEQTVMGSGQVLRLSRVFKSGRAEVSPSVQVNSQVVECILSLDKPVKARIGQRVIVRVLAAPHPDKAG